MYPIVDVLLMHPILMVYSHIILSLCHETVLLLILLFMSHNSHSLFLLTFSFFYSHLDDQSEILAIVFVRRRYAARVLSKLINTLASTSREYDHLKSDFVTGHGSGMWGLAETQMDFKKQNDVLKKFRLREINVLVGTSVVEEGVDIPRCNLVVMFDFPQNFRAFVQSRGRGRAKGAKYVMLVPENEFEIHKQELLVRIILNNN